MRNLALLALLSLSSLGLAQMIVVDEGTRAAGLWCFPVAGRTGEYRYLPAGLKLSTGPNGKPEFSYLRYVENKKSADATSETITQADGGGILHFLIQMDTPDQLRQRAEAELSTKTQTQAKLVGPVALSRCRYHVVSSFASQNGVPRLFMSGQAPIFEGQKVAVSLGLDKRESQILMASLQTDTPDVSVIFEAEFDGLTKAFDADVTVDWSLVNRSERIRKSGDSIFAKFEVDKLMQELKRTGAIKVVTRGSSAAGEALTYSMADRMSALMFRREELPPEKEEVKKTESGILGFLKGASDLYRSVTYNPLDISLTHSYRLRQIQSTGLMSFSLSSQASVTRGAMLAYNLGDIYKRYGSDQTVFRLANLSDPAYDQREVVATIDLANAADFQQYVNSVAVTLRKRHENGATTLKEFVIDSSSFAAAKNRFAMLYGVNGDKDREKWMEYDYRVMWSFKDGGSYSEDWKTATTASVNLTAPFQPRTLVIDADAERLKSAKVRYALVKIEYDQFGQKKRIQLPFRTGSSTAASLVLVQPKNNALYDLSIEWVFEDGTKQVQPFSKTDSSIILVDIIPSRDNHENR
jgi:hypothetical protein